MASDTLRHQPMGASHMTMLQLRGPIRSCVLPWWLFIAVDTLCQHPMRTGHMTVLQSCGLMEFRVLQWCHPMPARAEGGQAVVPGSLPCMVRESGFRPAQPPPLDTDHPRQRPSLDRDLPATSFTGGNKGVIKLSEKFGDSYNGHLFFFFNIHLADIEGASSDYCADQIFFRFFFRKICKI